MATKRKTGRPEFKPTDAQRNKVSIAAGGGMSHEEIAIGIGISRNSLRKHFAHELAGGAYGRRLEVFEAMHRAAKKGNVAAQKAYIALTPQAEAPPLAPPAETAEPAKPQGKKAQAQAAAATAQAGTEWGDLLPPGSPLQ